MLQFSRQIPKKYIVTINYQKVHFIKKLEVIGNGSHHKGTIGPRRAGLALLRSERETLVPPKKHSA